MRSTVPSLSKRLGWNRPRNCIKPIRELITMVLVLKSNALEVDQYITEDSNRYSIQIFKIPDVKAGFT